MAKSKRRGSANQRIASGIVDMLPDIQRLEEQVAQEVTGVLTRVSNDVAKELENLPLTLAQTRKREQLLARTDATIAGAYRDVDERMKSTNLQVAELTQAKSVNLMNGVFKAEIAKPVLTQEDLKAIAGQTMVQGRPQEQWLAKQNAQLVERYRRKIQDGVASGKTIPQIVEDVAGKKTGRKRVVKVGNKSRVVDETTGGVFDLSKAQATALVRTSVLSVHNEALMESYRGNSDVIKGVLTVATLDTRTSPVCRARDGWAWDLVTSEPITHHGTRAPIPFPGPPPWHYNCRTTLAPITRSWEELAGQKVEGVEEIPEGTRASMDGQVPETTTYETWLEDKEAESPGFAADILGPTQYRLWTETKAALSDFIRPDGTPKTVLELNRDWSTEAKTLFREPSPPELPDSPTDDQTGPQAPHDRQNFDDIPITGVIRRLAVDGWARKDIEATLKWLGYQTNPNTIKTQIQLGKSGKKAPPAMTDEQKQRLSDALNQAKTRERKDPPPPPPKPTPPQPKPTPEPKKEDAKPTGEPQRSLPTLEEITEPAPVSGIPPATLERVKERFKDFYGVSMDDIDRLDALVKGLPPVPAQMRTLDERNAYRYNAQLRSEALVRALAEDEKASKILGLLNYDAEYETVQRGKDPANKHPGKMEAATELQAQVLEALFGTPRLRVEMAMSGERKTGYTEKQVGRLLTALTSRSLAPFMAEATGSALSKMSVTKSVSWRAFYRKSENTLYVGHRERLEVIAHEYGHHIENMRLSIQNMVTAFRDRRTEGDPLKSMKDLVPAAGYDRSEVTREDDFFDPYVGRVYPSGSTEILSMGIQEFLKEPHRFAKKDREHLQLVLEVLIGGGV